MFPQWPQLPLSVFSFTQLAPHIANGALQPQAPRVHGTPVAHVFPHEPQLVRFDCVSMHDPPQKL